MELREDFYYRDVGLQNRSNANADMLIQLALRVTELEKKVKNLQIKLSEAKQLPEYTPEFIEWYSAYPRKANKKMAFQVWVATEKVRPNHRDMMIATRAYAESKKNTDRKYIPHPSSWLNREGWTEDEAVPSGVTKLKVNRGNKQSTAMFIGNQAPDWGHHRKWQTYVDEVSSGETELKFIEWLGDLNNAGS